MYQKNIYLTTLEQAIIITALAEFTESHFARREEDHLTRSESGDLIGEAAKSIYKKIVYAKHEKINDIVRTERTRLTDLQPTGLDENLANLKEQADGEKTD